MSILPSLIQFLLLNLQLIIMILHIEMHQHVVVLLLSQVALIVRWHRDTSTYTYCGRVTWWLELRKCWVVGIQPHVILILKTWILMIKRRLHHCTYHVVCICDERWLIDGLGVVNILTHTLLCLNILVGVNEIVALRSIGISIRPNLIKVHVLKLHHMLLVCIESLSTI